MKLNRPLWVDLDLVTDCMMGLRDVHFQEGMLSEGSAYREGGVFIASLWSCLTLGSGWVICCMWRTSPQEELENTTLTITIFIKKNEINKTSKKNK